ncbi:MAG: hypothetical protein IPP38_10180 [Bacteroidetes bacterium]|nr:hypothetical protein [Bacteroidota bacterium]
MQRQYNRSADPKYVVPGVLPVPFNVTVSHPQKGGIGATAETGFCIDRNNMCRLIGTASGGTTHCRMSS